ncbi:hypothetical protein C0971_16230 [Bacillus methanolicus]|uniref:hypothetical protein n=1 Tax=Bacillus methanolicus TaxID=1471 RepID=UPI00200E18EB|nr:hypothetical protein [Bacillus methanolicus]UQD53394.1 hypothetical protein C0971_16230 [Bacillus methanolicus]
MNLKHESIPSGVTRSRYWKPVIYLFSEHPKLQNYYTTEYFDLNARGINVKKLRQISKYWSTSEKFILNLALHLYNSSTPIDLGEIDYLDEKNKKLVLTALQFRFGFKGLEVMA